MSSSRSLSLFPIELDDFTSPIIGSLISGREMEIRLLFEDARANQIGRGKGSHEGVWGVWKYNVLPPTNDNHDGTTVGAAHGCGVKLIRWTVVIYWVSFTGSFSWVRIKGIFQCYDGGSVLNQMNG
ncbi:hypothetical protein B296_00052852 [Ensete ventricosum]|uniref:Uncharacterized protein n=1 Tax=Ensete ventricosum TaxID=4639 RepID=A0A426XFB7_ENSVE|nr:hypothetical protein B296_00052852 [Ensete ventricosum]